MSCAGNVQCYRRGCRSDPCRAANTTYCKRMIRRSRPLVDASEVREHLAWLKTRGVSLNVVSERTGLTKQQLSRIKLGQIRRVRVQTANGVLAVGSHHRRAS